MRAIIATISIIVVNLPLAMGQIVRVENDYGARVTAQSERLLQAELIREAKLQLQRVSRVYSASPAADYAVLLEAQTLIQAHETELAEQTLLRLVTRRPNSPYVAPALFLVAELACEERQYAKAQSYFEKTARQAQQDFTTRSDSLYYELAASAWFWDGVTLAQQGMYEEAAEPMTECADRYPANRYADDAIFFLGQFEEINRNNLAAIEYFTRAARDYPTSNVLLASRIRNAQNHVILRNPTLALAELENAETCLNEIAASDPEFPVYEPQTYADNAAEETLILRGDAHNLGGRYEQALASFNALLGSYPESKLTPRAHLGAGWSLLNLHRNTDALTHYDAVIDNQDTDPETNASALLFRAVALKRDGKREEALKAFKGLGVRSGFPLVSVALLELGQMYYEDGKMDEARRALERAERESSDGSTFVRIQLLLGGASLDAGYYSTAASAFEKARKMAEKSTERFMPNKEKYLAEARLKEGIALVGARKGLESITALNTFLAQHPGDERRAEAIFWLAEAHYQSGMIANAAERYQQIMRDYPTFERREEAMYGLGWTQFRTRKFVQSAATFTRLLREYPESRFALDVLTRKGDGHYLSSQYRAAADAYRQASRRNERNDQTLYCHYQLGQALYRLKQHDQAARELQAFVNIYPSSPFADDAYYTIAWIRFEQKRYADAIVEYQNLLERYPQTRLKPDVQYSIADAYFNNGQFEQAIEAYQTVVDTYGESPYLLSALNGINYALVMLGREDEASLAGREYLEANPQSPAAQAIVMGNISNMFVSGNYQGAIQEYENFVNKFPESEKRPEALFKLGQSYASLGQADGDPAGLRRADSVFAQVTKQYPVSSYGPQAAIERAKTQKTAGRGDIADSLYGVVQQLYPDSAAAVEAAFEQAYLRETMGDTTRAIDGYRKLAERYPDADFAASSRFRIGWYYRENKILDSARAEFILLVDRNDNMGAQAQYLIGESYLWEKNYDEAAKAFLIVKERFSEYEDWNTRSLIGLGECYENQDKITEAKEIYRLVIALRQEDDYGKTARSRLDRLTKL